MPSEAPLISPTRWRRLASLGSASALMANVLAAMLIGLLAPPVLAAGPLCVVPGNDGPPAAALTGVVNSYYPGTADAAAGATTISVGARRPAANAPIAAGDMLLVIQVQDALINSTNTSAYGDGVAGDPATGSTNLQSSGLYEYVRATGPVAAGVVPIRGAGAGNGLLNLYHASPTTANTTQHKFEVVRVPQYSSATLSSTLTASDWDGATGGILAVDVAGGLNLNTATVSLTGLGFRGGAGRQLNGDATATNTDYRFRAPVTPFAGDPQAGAHGSKAEGVAGTPRWLFDPVANTTVDFGVDALPNGSYARGAPGNGGGGGTDGNPAVNDQNSGGGGGANGGAGGMGGNTWKTTLNIGGFGGTAVGPTAARLFLGGGGGAGPKNNDDGVIQASAGTSGGGAAFLRVGSVSGTGTINANGSAAFNNTLNDGGGGGGAGGSVIVQAPTGVPLTGLTAHADGARGGDTWHAQAPGAFPGNRHGPGGGGGGGIVLTSSAPTAATAIAGLNGITTTANDPYGATPGTAGVTGAATTLGTEPGASAGAICQPQLTVTKTTSTPNVVNGPGGTAATYSITVSNAAGKGDAINTNITDTLPPGFTYASTGAITTAGGAAQTSVVNPAANSPTPTWGVFTVPGGGQVQITFTVNINSSVAPGTYNNSVAAVYSDPQRTVPGGTTSALFGPGAPVTVSGPMADVSVVKSHAGNFTVGTNGTYNLLVANAGPSPSGALTVSDTLPAGLTFVSGTGAGWACSAAGQVVTCTDAAGLASGANTTIALVVGVGAAAAPSVTNTATVSSATADPNLANNTSSDPTTVNPSADVSIVKSHAGTFRVGVNGTYSLLVSNAGPSASGALTVSDTLPAGLTFVSGTGAGWACSAVGQVVTCSAGAGLATGSNSTITLVVGVGAVATPSVTNTATAAGTVSDPNPANNTSSDPTAVSAASADVSIVKSHAGNFTVGADGTYSLLVANAGPSPSGAITVSDTLPSGLTFVSGSGAGWACSAAGQVVTCTRAAGLVTGTNSTVTLVVSVGASAAPSVTNTATANGTAADPNPANNTSSDPTTVNPSADVSIAKSHAGNFTVGVNGTYSLLVSNAGPSPSGTLTVSDTLPAGLTFVSGSGAGWACSAAGQVVTCTSGAGLATGTNSTITLVVGVGASAAPSVTNTATANGTTADPNPANNTSSDPTSVVLSADVSIVKSHAGSFTVGVNGTYSLLVTNAGPSASGALTVNDTLPAGLTFVSGTGAGWACSAAGQAVTCTRAAGLASGTNSTITLTVGVGPGAPPSLTNTATVSGTSPDPNPANNTSSDPTAAGTSADVSIVKSHAGNFTVGANGTYSLLVGNAGPSPSGAISVSDTLPAGLSFVSGTGPGWACSASGQVVTCTDAAGLASGANSTISLVVGVGAAAAPSVTNTATVSATAPDPNPANNMSSDPTTVNPTADVSIVKSHTGNFSVGVNGTYSLLVSNAGPSPSGSVTVGDTLPAGLTFVSGTGPGWACSAAGQVVTCTNAAGLASGANTTITLVVGVGVAAAPSVTNTATANGTADDPNPANNTSSDPTTVGPSADVSIVKSHAGSFSVGVNGTYTLLVANAGPSASGALTVSDTLPNGLTFVSGTGAGWACSAAGQVVTCTDAAGLGSGANSSITLIVGVGAAAAPSVTNTATVTGTTPDPNPGNNTSSDPTTVGPTADVSIVKSHAGSFTVGVNGTYSLLVSNAGPSASGALTVSDTLPTGLTFVSGTGAGWACSAAGQVVTCTNAAGLASGANTTITLVVGVGAAAAPSVTNTATVSGTTPDPNLGNNTSSDPTTVGPTADVSIVKSHAGSFTVGVNGTYSLLVSNAGPSASGALTVSDTLPTGLTFVSGTGAGWACSAAGQVVTCTDAAGLASGANSTITLVVGVGAAAAPSVTNTATANGTTPDPNPGNNTSSDPTTVNPSADVSIVKSHSGSFTVGVNGTYSLLVSNAGLSPSGALTVSDTLPAGLSFVSGTGAGWSCSAAGQVVTCTDAAGLASGANSTITLVVGVGAAAAPSVTNTATVTGTTPDPNPANNTSSDPTTVGPSADVSVVKSHAGNFSVGVNGTYTLLVSNAGPSASGALTVSDTLPTGLTFVSGTGAGWACSAAGQVVTCTDAAGLASGANTTITLVVGVGAAAAPSVTNTATVSGTTPDPNLANNTSSDPTTVNPSADVSIVKSHSGSFTVGVNGTYTLLVANAGPSASGALTVSDTLPAGLTFVSGTGAGWACSAAGQVVTCTNAAGLASGANTTITLVVGVGAAAAPGVTNTATVTGTTPDPTPGNNTSGDPTPVNPSADVSIVKSHSGAFSVGVNGTYTLLIANAGPSPSGALTVSDTLPAGLSFVSATGAGWACSAAGQVITCTDAAGLASGANTTITLVVGVGAAAAPSVTNTATVTGTTADPNPGNNTSNDATVVGPNADVSIVKSHSGSFTVGVNGTYLLLVSNAGPSPSGALTVSDTLPSGLSFVSA
ncbi:MAG: hypothetical protein ACR2MY_14370, partial [Candidatus Dormibacteria bacterium]